MQVGVVSIAVVVVVGGAIAVGVDPVVPGVSGTGMDRAVGIVAVVSTISIGVVSVGVGVIVGVSSAVCVDAVVPGIVCARIGGRLGVVAVFACREAITVFIGIRNAAVAVVVVGIGAVVFDCRRVEGRVGVVAVVAVGNHSVGCFAAFGGGRIHVAKAIFVSVGPEGDGDVFVDLPIAVVVDAIADFNRGTIDRGIVVIAVVCARVPISILVALDADDFARDLVVANTNTGTAGQRDGGKDGLENATHRGWSVWSGGGEDYWKTTVASSHGAYREYRVNIR